MLNIMNLLRKAQNNTIINNEQLINMYELLFEHYPDPIYILDINGNMLASNKATSLLFDQKIKNIHEFISKYVLPPYIANTLDHYNTCIKGEFQHYHSLHILQNEQIVETSVYLLPLFQNQTVVGVLLLISDITDIEEKRETLSRLEMSVHHLEELVDIGTWDYDITENKAHWSDNMYAMFDLDMNEYPTYEKVFERVHPEDRDLFESHYKKAIEEKSIFSLSYRIIKRDGSEHVLNQYADVLLDDNKRPIRMIGTSHDITEQVQIQTKMQEQEEHVKKIYNNLDAGIWSVDIRENSVQFMSDGIQSITGYTSEEFEEGRIVWSDLIYSEDLPLYQDRQETLNTRKAPRCRYRITHRDGSIRWVEDNTIPVFCPEGELIRLDGIITDMTEQIKSEELMAHIAYHDYLTGLPNRRMFEEELNAILESSIQFQNQFAVLYIDMDGFKRINDTLGHMKGDQLLIEISSRLRENLSNHDFVARIGGDEFTVLLRQIDATDEAVSFAKKLILSLEEPFYMNGYELFITASIGMTIYPTDGEDAGMLMSKADTALYRAKEMGKNNYQIYTSSMNIESFKIFQLEKDLRKAIKNNELLVHYQPKVETTTGKLVGAEALIRWQHPEWGMISPHEFIPIAEENALIIPITDWVIRTVCEQLNEWRKLNTPLVPISINMSPKRFLKNDWVSTILKILQDTGVTPSLLDLEITESALIQNEESFISSIDNLKRMGITFSLDDFGTGFSSFLYLKKFQVDSIKIDRSFIRDCHNESETEIVKSIIYLAHGLKKTVVAEGVETENQLRFLRQHDCDVIQGYLFSKPVPPEEFTTFFKEPILTPIKPKPIIPVEDKRKAFRLDLTYPLITDLTIVKITGKEAKLGTTEVLVDNIGPGGLRFKTHLRLPASPDILFKYRTEILGETISLLGKIAWKQEASGECFLYGVQFILNESQRMKMTKLLNKLSIQIQKTPIPLGCRMVGEDDIEYVEKNLMKR